MTQNIFKLLYIVAGFMILLMGLFSFFNYHSQYNAYYASVQDLNIHSTEWIMNDKGTHEYKLVDPNDEDGLDYKEIMAEIGGYYSFDKEVILQIDEYEYKGILTQESMNQIIHKINKERKYSMEISEIEHHLQNKIRIKINEVKGK